MSNVDLPHYPYYSKFFQDEAFQILSYDIRIPDKFAQFILNVKSFDKMHISALMIDRISQSLGFSLLAYLCKQKNLFFRYFLIKSLSFQFEKMISPKGNLECDINWCDEVLTPQKIKYKLYISMNANKVSVDSEIIVILPKSLT